MTEYYANFYNYQPPKLFVSEEQARQNTGFMADRVAVPVILEEEEYYELTRRHALRDEGNRRNRKRTCATRKK